MIWRAAARALVTAILLGLVWLAGVFAVRRAADPIEGDRRRDRIEQARTAASALRQGFRSAATDLEQVAQRLEPLDGAGNSGRAGEVLPGLVPAPGFGEGIFLTTLEGSVIAASASRQVMVDERRAVPEFAALRGAVASRVVVSDVHADPITGGRSVAVAVAVRDSARQPTALLVGISAYESGWLGQALGALVSPSRSVVVVSPTKTTYQAAETPSPPRPATDDERATVDDVQTSGATEYLGEGDVRIFAARSPVEGGWVLRVDQPLAEFRAPFDRPVQAASLVLAVVAAGFLVALTISDVHRGRVAATVDQAKHNFLAIAGHELRTPLTGIKGFTRTLLGRWDRVPEEQRREIVESVSRQARSLEHLIQRLLVGAQLEAGVRIDADTKPIDITRAIRAVVEHYDAIAPLHTFHVDVEEPLVAEADFSALEEALTNVVENAVKYSPSGGSVWVSGRRHGRHVEVTIDDEGVGLPSDFAHIFGRFEQGEPVNTRLYDEGGMGLGLFIAATYVREMGGSIRAERRNPAGSRFVIRLRAGT